MHSSPKYEYMSRTKFSIAGKHPLLTVIRDYLILSTLYELVPWEDQPDFCLYGAVLCKGDNLHERLSALCRDYDAIKTTPVVLLHGKATEGRKGVFLATVRELFLPLGTTREIEIFPVYGPNVHVGVVHKFITQARKKEALTVSPSLVGLMHEADFLPAFAASLTDKRKIVHLSGLELSAEHLAETVWGFTNEGTSVLTKDIPFKGHKVGLNTVPPSRSTRAGIKDLCQK